MVLELDLEAIHSRGLTPNQFVYLKLLFLYDKDELLRIFSLENEKKVKDDLYKLYQKGYIKLELDDNHHINIDTIQQLIESVDTNVKDYIKSISTEKELLFDEFMVNWYALFPKGVVVGGYPVRSGLTGCKKKMVKFLKKHKNVEYADIIKATKSYIDRHRTDGYKFMKLAHYFIEKDGVSTLESVLENNTQQPNIITYGSTRG